jgi:uncharacterized protein
MGIPHPERWAGPAMLFALTLALLLAPRPAAAVPIPLLDISRAGFVGQAATGPLDQPTLVTGYIEFTGTFGASTAGLANPYLAPSVAAYFANYSAPLWIVRTAGADDASLIGVDGGPGARTGLQALRDVDEVGAVAIPGATSPAVQAALLAHCESMGYRMAVLDPVSQTDPDAVTAQRAALSTADGFGALYFPWVVGVPTGVTLTLPPSGFVAGIYARTSLQYSPSGTTYGSVNSATGVSYAVNSTLGSTLNSQGIDAIRNISPYGVLAFGARTLASNTDWQYVSVRRIGFDVQKSLQYGTAWALQQPNDETLWAQLRSDAWDFLYPLWQAGWFQGATPSEAFFVHCDATTMTADDLAAGRTVILVGIAPLRAAEFLLLRIVQQRPSSAGVTPGLPALALRSPSPNPFRSGTAIGFELARTGAIWLCVLDVTGRTVRTLADGEVAGAGPQQRAWDGRDDDGRALAPGVYLVRLQSDGQALTRRVALLR